MKGAIIMAKSASVYARIDPALKEQAETILSALGIPTSNAIDMFFKQIVLKKGLPFEVRYHMKNLSAWERLVKKN